MGIGDRAETNLSLPLCVFPEKASRPAWLPGFKTPLWLQRKLDILTLEPNFLLFGP